MLDALEAYVRTMGEKHHTAVHLDWQPREVSHWEDISHYDIIVSAK